MLLALYEKLPACPEFPSSSFDPPPCENWWVETPPMPLLDIRGLIAMTAKTANGKIMNTRIGHQHFFPTLSMTSKTFRHFDFPLGAAAWPLLFPSLVVVSVLLDGAFLDLMELDGSSFILTLSGRQP